MNGVRAALRSVGKLGQMRSEARAAGHMSLSLSALESLEKTVKVSFLNSAAMSNSISST